jgi:dTDP-4-dehydrorhamnose 3,5-epimerase
MTFQETGLKGVWEVHLTPHTDERGFFARSWCRREFESHGLSSELVQCNISFNAHRGTLRGLHYQAAPYEEAKLVRCTRGALYDVVVDLRPDSPTFKEWISIVLTSANRAMIYVPPGCAHGFLTLEDETEVFYQMSADYSPECARGVRWDDPAFAVLWPEPVHVISSRDRNHPDFATFR